MMFCEFTMVQLGTCYAALVKLHHFGTHVRVAMEAR